MKKNNIIKFLGVVLLASGFTACNDDDESYASVSKPAVTIASTELSGVEGSPIMMTMNTSLAISRTMDFKVEVIGGTAVEHEDYEFNIPTATFASEGWGVDGYRIAFPAYTEEYTFALITPILDDVVDDGETLQLKITTAGNHNGILQEQIVNITIGNKAQNVVSFVFDWDQSFEFFGAQYTLCEIAYDMDILIVDAEGNASYAAGTGDCPEVYDLDITDLEAGSYDFYNTVYDNVGLDGAGLDFSIPVRMSYTRLGSATLNGEYTQSAANAYDTSAPSDPDVNDARYIATVTIAEDGTVTISDDGTVIASGRMAQAKKAIKNLQKLNKPARPNAFN